MSRPPPTFGDLLSICRERRWLVVLIWIVVSTPLFVYFLSRAPLYEASVRLLVNDDGGAVDFKRTGSGSREFALVNTYRELLLSPGVLEEVLESSGVGQESPYHQSAEAVLVLEQRVRVLVNRDSWMLTITCKDEVPKRAALLVQTWAEVGIGRLRNRSRHDDSAARGLLEQRLVEARDNLAEANQKEQDFRKRTGIISSDPRDNHFYSRLVELQKQRADMDRTLEQARTVDEQLVNALSLVGPERVDALLRVPSVASEAMVSDTSSEIRNILVREAELSEKYLEKHPRMIEIRAQLDKLRAELGESSGLVAQRLRENFQRMQRESASLDDRLIEAERGAGLYRDNLANLSALEQETRSREEVVRYLAARHAELGVTKQMEEVQLQVVDSPQSSNKPVGIPRVLLLIGAGFGGLFVGAGAVVIIDFLDQRLRGPGFLRSLGQKPVLAELPVVKSTPRLGVAHGYAFEEGVRNLRTRLKFATSGVRGAIVVVAAIDSEAGATTTLTHLAVALGSAGDQVLVVDANMRNPAIENRFGQQGGAGFSQLLAGEPGVAPFETAYANVQMLGPGLVPPNPAELLNSHCLPEWLSGIRPDFDFILIDAPALAAVSDAMILAEFAHGIILVARDRRTRRDDVVKVWSRMQPVAERLIGTVLNFNRTQER